jgi:hypothetical protein
VISPIPVSAFKGDAQNLPLRRVGRREISPLEELVGERSPPSSSQRLTGMGEITRVRLNDLVVAYICTCDRVAMLQLEIWSHNKIFYRCIWCMFFIVYWCFPFVCFSIEPTASHFNIYCLHFCLISSVSYDEWRIKTIYNLFIIIHNHKVITKQ